MKVGCFAVVDPFQTIEHQLKRLQEMGIQYADVTDTNSGGSLGKEFGFNPTISLDENPLEVKRMFSKYGLTITTVCAHSNLLDPSSAGRYGNNEIVKAIKFASFCGVDHVITTEGEPSTPWGESLSFKESVLIIAEKLIEPVALANDLGIKILLEPHGPITGTMKGMQAILDKLGNPACVGICMDTGNSWLAGSDPIEYAKTFKDIIYHIHWKDLSREWEEKRGGIFGCGMSITPLGQGVIDVAGVYDVLKDAPHVEYSTLEIAGEDSILKSYDYLKGLGAE